MGLHPSPASLLVRAGAIVSVPYLTQRQIERIELFRTIYDTAVTCVHGLPWQALVPIHFRESEFREKGDVPGEGAFGCDVGGEGEQLDRIDAAARAVAAKYGYPVPEGRGVLDLDVGLAALVAAHELFHKARAPILHLGRIDETVLCDAWWGYNGKSRFHVPQGISPDDHGVFSRRSWHYSPYVSNDPARGMVLLERSRLPADADHPTGLTIDRPDKRAGCLAIWRDMAAAGLMV